MRAPVFMSVSNCEPGGLSSWGREMALRPRLRSVEAARKCRPRRKRRSASGLAFAARAEGPRTGFRRYSDPGAGSCPGARSCPGAGSCPLTAHRRTVTARRGGGPSPANAGSFERVCGGPALLWRR